MQYIRLSAIEYTDNYGPHNLKGQKFGYMGFDSYDNGNSYIRYEIDNWGNKILMEISLKDDGTLSFISDVIEESPTANFVFSDEWILRK